MRWAPLALVVVLAACQTEPHAAQSVPQGSTLSESDRAVCLAQGGMMERAGALGNELCFRPEPDAGKACTRAADCSGFCLADQGTCSVVRPQFGCFDFLDEAGRRMALCLD